MSKKLGTVFKKFKFFATRTHGIASDEELIIWTGWKPTNPIIVTHYRKYHDSNLINVERKLNVTHFSAFFLKYNYCIM